ncbi:anthranilate synthase component II [Comamonas testosteroni]|uniref:anthranilate synthase component II n=1 Tax=Comamonas testosteroni TaxID=285 RepID=UPI0015F80EF5|nr:aminodeoxychorismate/anthranilate synthase component II [Comamonas testosteroni]
MNVILVDAYDSFIYTIDHYLRTLGLVTKVMRCDDSELFSELTIRPSFVVLGPGPGRPEEAGYLQIIDQYKGVIPILGVCLGHQAIGMAFGGEIIRSNTCMHGKTSRIINDGLGVFRNNGGKPFAATRYHSLVVSEKNLPADLVVSGYANDDHQIMGLRHRFMPIEGVQFHPESIATKDGASIFSCFIEEYVFSSIVPHVQVVA